MYEKPLHRKGFLNLKPTPPVKTKKTRILGKIKVSPKTYQLINVFMYSKRIPTYARFQWLNNPIVINILEQFLKPNPKGRKGYGKVLLFRWLIYRQLMSCSFRDLESMSEIDYSTFIKFRKRLIEKFLFKNIFSLLSSAVASNLDSITAIMDSSFVQTYSKRQEEGSEYFGYKEKNGFKLHQMIDWETRLPILQFATPGARSDIRWGANLIRAAPKSWKLREFTADKAYDGINFVKDIALRFPGIRICIPMRRHKKKDYWFNRLMKRWERVRDPELYKKRSEIERYFSRKKRVFNLGEERTRGLKNFEANCYLTSIAEILEWSAKPEIWV